MITFRWGAAPGHSNELWGETGRGGQHTERDLWRCHAKRGTILPSSALVTGELMTVLEVTFTQKHPKESQSLAKVWASQQKKKLLFLLPRQLAFPGESFSFLPSPLSLQHLEAKEPLSVETGPLPASPHLPQAPEQW